MAHETPQQKWGHDINVGQATLKFADSFRPKGKDIWLNAGWAIPGGDRITDSDYAQYICYRMSVLIGGEKPRFPRTN